MENSGRNRKLAPSSFFFLLGAIAAIAWGPVETRSEPRMKIGLSVPLTGSNATFGTDLKNIIQFANTALAGDRYELVVEDDHCEGKSALSVAHKLVHVDRVAAVFFACDTAAVTAAPVYRDAGVLVLTPLVTTPRFSRLGGTFFRLAPNDAENARILVRYISSRYRRLGILTEAASEYCEDLAAELEKAASNTALAISHERFNPGTNDFKTLLLRLKAQGIDALLINPNAEELFVMVLRQLRELKLEIPVFGAYAPGSSTFLRLAGPLAEGIVYTDFPSLSAVMKENGGLFEKFTQEYGALNSWDFIFATGIESFRVMHQALQQPSDPAGYIHSTTFQGVIGSYSFDQFGDIRGMSNEIRRIAGGEGVPLEPGAPHR